MPRIAYAEHEFSAGNLDIIDKSNAICAEFADRGINLTLRGLYYRLVARDLFPDSRKWAKLSTGRWVRDADGTKNADPNYKWLGTVINDARLAGLVDWEHLTDSTRNLRDLAHWADPESIMDAVARQYRHELWKDQKYHVEVWIEKDALVGVIEGVCRRNDVPFFSCRGYTSQTSMWEAAQRLIGFEDAGQQTIVIHLGDHDPSGIDMTRDIQDRLSLFGSLVRVERVALTMDQVEQYDPPPNPAKLTDSRVGGYMAEYGDESWELDALDPAVLDALIQAEVERWRDDGVWQASVARQEYQKGLLVSVRERWPDVVALVDGD
jgi:hypothetical protein